MFYVLVSLPTYAALDWCSLRVLHYVFQIRFCRDNLVLCNAYKTLSLWEYITLCKPTEWCNLVYLFIVNDVRLYAMELFLFPSRLQRHDSVHCIRCIISIPQLKLVKQSHQFWFNCNKSLISYSALRPALGLIYYVVSW